MGLNLTGSNSKSKNFFYPTSKTAKSKHEQNYI